MKKMAVDADASKVPAAPGALQARTVQEFLEHARHLTTKALGFPRRHVTDITYYSPQQIFGMAQRATEEYVSAGLPRYHPSPAVVGLRVVSTIEWVVSFVALIRLGYTVLVLSPTIAPNKVGGLMDKANCSIVIDGTSITDEAAAEELRSTLQGEKKTVIPLTRLESLMHNVNEASARDEDDNDNVDETQRWSQINQTHPVIILHSSGSTGVPKLFHKTHAAVLDRLRGLPAMLHGTSLIGSKLYLSVGMHLMLFSLVRANGPSVWSNDLIPLDASKYRDMLVKLQPQTLWFNPTNLQGAMSTREGLEVMRQCDLVVTTGGVFPTQLGQRLVQAGVHLVSIYGMSELSSGVRLTSASRKRGDPDWEYVQPSPATAPHIWFRPLDMADEGSTTPLFELVILPSHPTQDKRFANQPDGSFYTGDLFVQHPTRPGCYKCLGRMSDEIRICPKGHDYVGLHALSYEHAAMIGNDHVLQEAVLFGRNRPEAGLLLFTKPGCTAATDDIVEGIWNSLQRDFSNGVLPVAVRKNLLVVIRDAVVPRTPKGNIVRPEVYLNFERAIVEAYYG